MKLYHNPMSPNARRARLTVAQLGIPVEEVLIDFRKGEHKRPEYLALNPNGAVPTLLDGDFALTESRAIMHYLAEQKPDAGLLPADARNRADVLRWQFWDAAHFSIAVRAVAFEKIIKPTFGMGDPDLAKIKEGLADYRRFAAVLDQRLRGKPYVVGPSLTLADLAIAASMMYAKPADLPLAETPELAAWFERMTALPAWKKSEA